MKKEHFFLFLAILLLALPFLLAIFWPSPKLKLIACNVGQGDAILLTQGFTQVLIDGGPGSRVLDCLNQNLAFYDRTIELVINTHPEKDHLTGLLEVIKRYQVKQLITDGVAVDTDLYQEFQKEVQNRKISTFQAKKGDLIKLGDWEFKVLWPPSNLVENYTYLHAAASQQVDNSQAQVLGKASSLQPVNDYSLVLQFKYHEFDALFPGDITSKVEREIIRDNQFSGIEVLKISHHGSKYSSSEEFLKIINPGVGIISVGKNSYGHPTQEVLDRLKNIGSQILRTDKDKIKLEI